MICIELESERTEDSLSTNDHYVEEQFTDPVWCCTYTTSPQTLRMALRQMMVSNTRYGEFW